MVRAPSPPQGAAADRLRGTDVSAAAQLTLAVHRTHPSGGTYSRLVAYGNTPLSTPVTAHRAGVCALAVSPDGRTLATGSFDRTVRLWNASDPDRAKPLGSPLTGYDKTTGSVRALAFSPDGRVLATGSYPSSGVAPITDPGLRLWDVSAPARPRPLSQTVQGAEYIDHLAFTPDGRTLVTSPAGMAFRLWNISDPKRPKALRKLIGHPGGVCALDFSPDGRTLATGSEAETAGTGNGSMFLWDVSDPARPQPLKRPRIDIIGGINALDFSPDGRTLAAAAGDSRVRLWDVSERTRAVPLGEPLSGAGVATLAFSPDAQTLVGGGSGAVRLWEVSDPRRPRALKTLTGFAGHISTTVFSPDGRTLATSEGSTVRLWEVSHPQQAAPLGEPLEGHTGVIRALAFSPDEHAGGRCVEPPRRR
ncbi:WD40 repeat domain-containing protein [Streptomyces sp. NPDC059590]|uniref:WD40 repeat domain-containing protein n=1 Tax=Streptomyces sp. NPDC059590 TaxID=3346877 RepID=UPI0036935394